VQHHPYVSKSKLEQKYRGGRSASMHRIQYVNESSGGASGDVVNQLIKTRN